MLDVEKLSLVFARDVSKCLRCKGTCEITLRPCRDALSEEDYGNQPYIECLKCKANNYYPWSSFLIVPDDF